MLVLSTRLKIQIAKCLSTLVCFGYRVAGIKSDIVIVERAGIFWELDLKEGIDLAIFLGIYEKMTIHAFQNLIEQGSTILDIGANIGAHTLHLAKLTGNAGRVYAFEPTQYAFSKLNKNINYNPILKSSIITEQMMLTDNNDKAPKQEIYSSWPLEKKGGVHFKHLGLLQSTEGAKAMTLDTYIEKNHLNSVDFIKLDVDGFEYKVLKGGLNTLKAHKPIIVMELAPYVLKEQGDSVDELIEFFKALNYNFYHLVTRKELTINAMKSWPSGKSVNIIAKSSTGVWSRLC